LQTSPWLLYLHSLLFLHLSSPMLASLARAFSSLVIFIFFFGGCIDLKIALETYVARALRLMVAEVNWEGYHHRDRWSSLLPNCHMVLVGKVSEQVLEAPGGLSEIHHFRGLLRHSQVLFKRNRHVVARLSRKLHRSTSVRHLRNNN
jgi:hypothetical protein